MNKKINFIIVLLLVLFFAVSAVAADKPVGAGQNNGVRGLAPDYHGGASGPSAHPHGPIYAIRSNDAANTLQSQP